MNILETKSRWSIAFTIVNVKHFLDHYLLLGRDHLTLVSIGAAIYA